MALAVKPQLSLLRIVEMNVGFFGLQFSFGLQQANMGPIYGFLGADEGSIPLLWIAGPVTGLLVQPLIGAMSDRTTTRLGRRTPYFLLGAILCSLSLFAMPFSTALWMAASLLWLLDAGNNITMEPYRAYIADRLSRKQRPAGFLAQSAATGLAQTMSYLAPSVLSLFVDRNLLDGNGIPVIVRIAFVIGAILSISTILYSILRVPELPLTATERNSSASAPLTLRQTVKDLFDAIREMPLGMQRLVPTMLCQWYAMFIYWQFIAFALARSLHHTADSASQGFRDAMLTAQQLGALYNFIAFLAAFGLIPLLKRLGARSVHAGCLSVAGAAMLMIPSMQTMAGLMILMIGIGLGWAGMMGNTYVMVADSIPPERTGIYMGLFNVFIVVPMLFETVTMPLLYAPILGADPRNAIMLAGTLMLMGALATFLARSDAPFQSVTT